jgi:hypothetical protein
MDAIPAVAPAVLLKEKGVKPPLPPPPAAQQAAAERAAAERAAAAAVVTTKERPGKPQDSSQTEGRDGRLEGRALLCCLNVRSRCRLFSAAGCCSCAEAATAAVPSMKEGTLQYYLQAGDWFGRSDKSIRRHHLDLQSAPILPMVVVAASESSRDAAAVGHSMCAVIYDSTCNFWPYRLSTLYLQCVFHSVHIRTISPFFFSL